MRRIASGRFPCLTETVTVRPSTWHEGRSGDFLFFRSLELELVRGDLSRYGGIDRLAPDRNKHWLLVRPCYEFAAFELITPHGNLQSWRNSIFP